MHKANALPGVAFALALATTASAAPATWAVEAQLIHKDHVFATPSAVVQDGVPATLEVTGPDGYRLAFIVTSQSADAVALAARLDSPRGNMAPTLVLRPDQPGSIRVGDLTLAVTVHRGS
jgi:hypothetical protein